MTIDEIYNTLKVILEAIKGKDFLWRIEGSANLIIQGVNVGVRDLDITTDDKGIRILRNYLNNYILQDFFSKKIKGKSLVCDINGFEVEINCYGDRKLNMFDKIKKIGLRDIIIPVLPLKYAKIFYENIGRQEKVDLIDKYLCSNI